MAENEDRNVSSLLNTKSRRAPGHAPSIQPVGLPKTKEETPWTKAVSLGTGVLVALVLFILRKKRRVPCPWQTRDPDL